MNFNSFMYLNIYINQGITCIISIWNFLHSLVCKIISKFIVISYSSTNIYLSLHIQVTKVQVYEYFGFDDFAKSVE